MNDWHTGSPPTSTVDITQPLWFFPCVSGWCLRIPFNTAPRSFSRGPVVKNPPCSTGDLGSTSGHGTKIPYAAEQLSLGTPTPEPAYSGACVTQPESLNTTVRDPAWCNKDPTCHNQDLRQPNKERKKYFKSTAPQSIWNGTGVKYISYHWFRQEVLRVWAWADLRYDVLII